MLKTCKILIILILITLIITPNVLASDFGSILEAGQDFLRVGDDPEVTIKGENLIKVNSNIFNIFFATAIIIAVVIGIVLGIQFMTSSVEGQAKVKEAVVPYLIGCVIVFAAFPIWKIVVGVGESTEKDLYTEEAGREMVQKYIEKLKETGGTYGDLVKIYQENYKNKDENEYYETVDNELRTILLKYGEGYYEETYETLFLQGLIYGFITDDMESDESLKQAKVIKNWYEGYWVPLQERPLSSF